MGNRANICVIQDRKGKKEQRIYLYGHWSGSTYIEDAERGILKYPNRQEDPAYFTRIIYDEFVGKQFGEETGFGISFTVEDNENPILVVDVPAQKVYIEGKKKYGVKFSEIGKGTPLRAMLIAKINGL